jgi:hypothetical protein
LSAGADRSFRVFSTIQDQQSRELSQKNTAARAKKARVTQEEIKLPRVTQMAACEVRQGAFVGRGGGVEMVVIGHCAFESNIDRQRVAFSQMQCGTGGGA